MKDGSSNGRGKKGIRDAIVLILSTGFCFGAVVAFILNALIPLDTTDTRETATDRERDAEAQLQGASN